MKDRLQRLYWASPLFVKNWMASVHAWARDRERYGRDHERIRREILARDGWTAQQFEDYQREQLRNLLVQVAHHVPYYRDLFRQCGLDVNSIRDPQDLRLLPILEKHTVRANPAALLDERLNPAKLCVGHTSGTTGTPLTLYRTVWLESAAYAYIEQRWHSVAGLHRRQNRSVSIGGKTVTDPARTRPPFWVHNRRWNQLYMSSYHLSPQYLDAYVDEIRKFQPDYIEAYPSSVSAVAQHILDRGLEPLSIRACFTTAETLFDHQRNVIRRALGCRTYQQYGCAEMCVFAAECPEGGMHLSPEIGIVEVVDEQDRPLPPGQVGQLICTSLINRVQPFIRYRLGDLGALGVGRCACGSELPLLERIEGRVDAVLITRDGRRIGRLDPVFKGAHGIAQAQIVQDDYTVFRIRIVPGPEYTTADGQAVAASLAERVGEADIRVELVDGIERTRAGKFPAVVCNLPQKKPPMCGNQACES
jgi:phenylacetate-CoA ligase